MITICDKKILEGNDDEESSSGQSEVSVEVDRDVERGKDGSEDGESDEYETELEDSDASLKNRSSNSEESSESDTSQDSDSDDSIWADLEGGKNEETQEASEASALFDFQRALDYLVKGMRKKAIKILNDLLKNPLVSVFHTEEFDWETETDERLSKMARLFVGVHKNLAKLEEEKAADHYLQILSIAPRNPEIWMDLGRKCIGSGDLDFAKFAFGKADTDEAIDALMSVLYLSRNYHACLRLISKCLENGIYLDKALFLKERIRSINQHYREFCDQEFGENRHYEEVTVLDDEKTEELSTRLFTVEDRLRTFNIIDPTEDLKPLAVTIDANQSLEDVVTIFCDIFDRIESYSSLARQEIIFSHWGDRSMLLDTKTVLDRVIDVIEIVDNLTGKVSSSKFKCRFPEFERTTVVSPYRDEIFVRRSTRNVENDKYYEWQCQLCTCNADQNNMPDDELARSLGLTCFPIIPLRNRNAEISSRTASPTVQMDFIDTDEFLITLRDTLMNGKWTIFEILSILLAQLAEHCPNHGALPANLYAGMTQCYRRLNRLSSNLREKRWMKLHVLMDELGEPQARNYCFIWHYTEDWPDRNLMIRFVWSHVKVITDDDIRLEFLRQLCEIVTDAEVILSGKGCITRSDILDFIALLERVERIYSIKQLRAAGRHDEVAAIVNRDIDFNSIDIDEVFEMTGFLLDAYHFMENYNEAVKLLNRSVHLMLSMDPLPEHRILPVLDRLYKIHWDSVDVDQASCMGYFLCRLSTVDSVKTNSILWITLYHIVQKVDGPISIQYIEKLDSSTQYDIMPSHALDVLVKAHEKLGAAHRCSDNEGAFLLFFLKELFGCVSDSSIMSLLRQDDWAWLWANVNEEIAQCLFCTFGRFTKRRRALEDHECKYEMCGNPDLAKIVIPLALPNPLPLYDDKERLGHDVVDLIQNKFPFMLEITDTRKKIVDNFHVWLRSTGKHLENIVINWPSIADESVLQASVWYIMALHHYRQSNHPETRLFAELFLTSGHATYENHITAGAWAILAHATVFQLFQLDDDQMLLEWEWHVSPFRMSLNINPREGVAHFEIASTLYQVATRLSRFFNTLPYDDWRLRRSSCLLSSIRSEATIHFEEALVLAQPTDASGMCEYQWLCYFFLAKIHAKLEDYDVVKVVDSLFEAACSCELTPFYYPVKINAKKQQNVEPVELHYQVHATVWKYLRRNSSPPLDILISLLSYIRTFQSHKVVRSNLSLFSIHPELHETVIRLTIQCQSQLTNDVEQTVHDLLRRSDVIDELWNLCHRGFELVCERFPHMKAHYRLAEMEISRNRLDKASFHLMKGIFKRKKKEDGMFDGVVEITCPDIDRSGSFTFHVERAFRLALFVVYRQKDLTAIVNMLVTMVSVVNQNNEEHILKSTHSGLISRIFQCLRRVVDTGSPRYVKLELFRLWNAIIKCHSSMLTAHLKSRLRDFIQILYGDVESFVAEQIIAEDNKKKQVRKRKLTSFDLATSQGEDFILSVSNPNTNAKSLDVCGIGTVLNASDECTAPVKLIRLALQAGNM